jgi:hypothetical protein
LLEVSADVFAPSFSADAPSQPARLNAITAIIANAEMFFIILFSVIIFGGNPIDPFLRERSAVIGYNRRMRFPVTIE